MTMPVAARMQRSNEELVEEAIHIEAVGDVKKLTLGSGDHDTADRTAQRYW